MKNTIVLSILFFAVLIFVAPVVGQKLILKTASKTQITLPESVIWLPIPEQISPSPGETTDQKLDRVSREIRDLKSEIILLRLEIQSQREPNQ